MPGGTWWVAILAIVASVLSAGGLVSQLIAWRREREKARVEVKKVRVEDTKNQREHTGQFQDRLMRRIDALEAQDKEGVKKLGLLEAANGELQAKYKKLDEAHRRLQAEYENLKRDYVKLREHVRKIGEANRSLRARLARLDTTQPGPQLVRAKED